MTPARVLEKIEQQNIINFFCTIGGVVYVLGTRRAKGDYHGTRQTPGMPDLIAFVSNMHVYVEVKSQRGRMSIEQRIFAANCERANVEHVVGGLDAVMDWAKGKGLVR